MMQEDSFDELKEKETGKRMRCVKFHLSRSAFISESTMREEIPADLSSTTLLMQIKKTSDNHLPCNMMSTIDETDKHISRAVPQLTRCVTCLLKLIIDFFFCPKIASFLI